MNKTLLTVVLVIVLIFAAGIFKDQIIRGVVTVSATGMTGAPVHMDGLSLGLFNHSVRIAGLKVYNPKGFPRGILIDIPKIKVSIDLGALFKKKIHVTSAEFELKEMVLVKNKKGVMNVDSLKVTKEKEKTDSKAMPMQINELKLSIGRIIVKDYTGPKPAVEVYEINSKKIYKNITSANQLVMIVLMEGMKSAGIRSAEMYGVSALAGVAILPVAVGFTLAGKDSATHDFNASEAALFDTALKVLNSLGRVTKEDWQTEAIEAEVDSASIALKITKTKTGKTQVTASARKYLMPKPEIAAGIIYQIEERIK
ncbi:MAG: AsmA family protein [Candidatus Omnitrophica bacterium]|nr:AsmA family protein [Candidatus Omnitrophota bacterium]